MRITQGTFSFLPELTDEEISLQIDYALRQGWACSVEYTDDPHPRNAYWEMWGQPLFDLTPEDSEVVLREVRACREAYPNMYIKLIAYDASRGRQTTALSFIVNRPAHEPGFALDRNFALYAEAMEPDSEELRQRKLERQDAEHFRNWKP